MTMSDNNPRWKCYLSPRFLTGKVQEKGVVWCLHRVAGKIYGQLSRPFYALSWSVHRLANFLSWLFPELRTVLRSVSESEKRILAIWDFRMVPFTVGELLYCQEVTLILRELHQVDKIDLVLLCDAEHPARADGGMDVQNFHYYFSKLLPGAFVNSHLGALLVMDSQEMLANYIADNHKRYYIFPPYVDAQGRSLTRYTQYFNYVQTFHAEHGYIPHLSCQPAMVMWAHQFLAANVRPRLPVTVQLRNTSTTLYRNAKLECWLEFFAHCETRYNVTFVMIGRKDEIDPRFRHLPNVLVAKDHGTTVEQDLALIQAGMAYLGSTCGPAIMALFSDLPYVLYNFRTVHEKKLVSGQPLPWATSLQKLVWETETTERLIADFTWLYEQIDTAQWACDFDRRASEASGKLKRRKYFHGVVIEGLGERSA